MDIDLIWENIKQFVQLNADDEQVIIGKNQPNQKTLYCPCFPNN